MKYQINCTIELDTRSNKVIVMSDTTRLVLYPGKKLAEHWVDVLINDRHQGAFSYAKDICKVLCQSLHGPKQHKKIVDMSDG